MPGDGFPYLTTAATSLIDTLALVEPWQRAVVITFDQARPEHLALYSNAAAVDLAPLLRAVLARVESGALRMPVTDAVRWVEVGPDDAG